MKHLTLRHTIFFTPRCCGPPVQAQLLNRTQQPNVAKEGIAKSLADQIRSFSQHCYRQHC